MLYSFDDYTLDAEHYELRQAERLVRLAPRVFNLVAHLVQHAGRLVTNEELKEQLWPESAVVGEASLANAVAQARKALGDTGQAQRYIQTVHRRGYRFVAPVTTQPPKAADLSAAPPRDPPRLTATSPVDQANLASKPHHTPSVRPSVIGADRDRHEGSSVGPGDTRTGLPLALGGCSGCGFENPAWVRFCIACGVPLPSRCPGCGTENMPEARFCGRCGLPLEGHSSSLPFQSFSGQQSPLSYTPRYLAEKILTTKRALEGERKQVTVLFAKLCGAMESMADRDPEEGQRLLDPLLQRILEAVHRYEGTVNHILGDGIMALFGVPLAHEDHAARACYAALAVQKAIHQYLDDLRRRNGVELQLWAGLNSGDVVVRTIGDDLHVEYSAVGQTTFLAARMEQLARTGGIWLTAETLRLVEGFFQVKPLGPLPIQGLEGPMDVYELIGAEPTRSRLQAATGRVLTPFVGRQQELEILRQALERAGTGHGQVVAVIGEPGVGKSRLFYEFTQAPRTKGWLILEAGAVSSYGQATPYLPVIDLLRAYFRVDGPDDGREPHEKVTDKLLALDEGLRPTLPALLMLLDVPVEDPPWQALDPPQRRQRTLDALRRVLLRESQVQPVLVIVENLHWIDTETHAFLDSLVDSLPTARLLLLVSYRPEFQHGWGNKSYYRQIPLDPLPPAPAAELLRALLGDDSSLQPLKQRLIERTEGNPFFLEESIRTLAEAKALAGERGVYRLAQALPSVQVPATVQAVLASRIDRLPAEEKGLLQVAAVIGKDVSFPLLQAIAVGPEEALRRRLAHLQAAEFLYETQLFPEHVYTFKHALTQEVAYHSLLQRTRKQYHQEIAQVLAARFPETLATQPELLAHHYTEAGLSAQAILYWQQAGQRAIERSANVEAMNHLTKGLEVLKTLPESPERSQQELALQLTLGVPLLMIKGSAVPEVEHVYTRAQELCQQIGDNRQRFSALVGLWRFYFNHPKLRTALELGEQCLTLAQGVQDKALIQEAHVMLGSTLLHLGELVSARTHLEAGIALYNSLRSRSLVFNRATDPGVTCLSRLAWLLWMLGYPDQALTKSQEALSLAQEVSHVYTLAFALHFATLLHQSRREVQFVQEQAEATIALSSEHGFIITLGAGVRMRGWALVEQGLAEQGIEQICQGLTIWQAQRSNLGLTQLLGLLAEAYGKSGQAAEGLDVLSKALIAVDENSEHHYEAELYRLKGELHLREAKGQKLEIIEECFLRAINIARSQQAKILELRAVISLSRLWQQWGKNTEARQMLAEIYGWFTEGFDTQDLQEAKSLLRALT